MIARGVRYKSHEGIDDPEVSVFTHVSVMMLNSTQINDFKKRVANGTINMGKTLMYSAKLKEVFDSNLRGLIPRTNWRLMNLDHRNLSQFQINKISSALDNKTSKRNKLNFIREQNKIGIKNFNVERFFMSTRNLS